MTVYVDDMYKSSMGQFGRMKMSHMIADTENELHAMAALIGVARKWYQGDHYDIAMSKRDLAIAQGAKEVTMRQLACMLRRKEIEGSMGSPDDVMEWFKGRVQAAANGSGNERPAGHP